MTTSPHEFMGERSEDGTGSRRPGLGGNGGMDAVSPSPAARGLSGSMGDDEFDLDLRDESLGDDRIVMAENSDAVCKPSDTPGCFTDMGKACSHDFGCDVITKKDPACGVTQTGGPTCHHQCPTEHGNTCAMTCVSPTCRHTCATCAGTCPETCDTCAATDCVADTCVDC